MPMDAPGNPLNYPVLAASDRAAWESIGIGLSDRMCRISLHVRFWV